MLAFSIPAARPSFSAAMPSTAFHAALLITAIWGTRASTIAIADRPTIEIPLDWTPQPAHHTMFTGTTGTIPGAPVIDAPVIPEIPQTDLPPRRPGVTFLDHWIDAGTVINSSFADTVSATQIFRESEVDDLPSLIAPGRLRYPPVLAEAGIEGAVTLTFVIDTEGKVDPAAIDVISATHPGFVAAAKETVTTSLFHPARKRGAAVRVRVRQTITFRP